ncbi:MAG: hypothetical protein ACLS8R_03625 [Anaeromassilibacillus sp.]
MKFDNDWERIREFSKLLYEVSQIPIQIADIHGATRLFFPSLPEFQEIGLPRSISESLIARAKQDRSHRHTIRSYCVPASPFLWMNNPFF